MYGYSNNTGGSRGGEGNSERSGGGSRRGNISSSGGGSNGGGGVYTDEWQGSGGGMRGRDRRENDSRIAILQAPDRGSGPGGRTRGSGQTYDVPSGESGEGRIRDTNAGSTRTDGTAFIDRFQGGGGKTSNRGLNYGSASGSGTEKAPVTAPSASWRNKVSLDSNVYDAALLKSAAIPPTRGTDIPNSPACVAMENSCFMNGFGDTLSHVLLLIGHALLPTTCVSQLKDGEKVMTNTVSMLKRKNMPHNDNTLRTAQARVPPQLKTLS